MKHVYKYIAAVAGLAIVSLIWFSVTAEDTPEKAARRLLSAVQRPDGDELWKFVSPQDRADSTMDKSKFDHFMTEFAGPALGQFTFSGPVRISNYPGNAVVSQVATRPGTPPGELNFAAERLGESFVSKSLLFQLATLAARQRTPIEPNENARVYLLRVIKANRGEFDKYGLAGYRPKDDFETWDQVEYRLADGIRIMKEHGMLKP